MPELPEVEFARRCWQSWSLGHSVTAVVAAPSRVLRPATPRSLRLLVGARFGQALRRGKNLLLRASRGGEAIGLWSHLGMTGKWVRRASDAEPPRFSRVRIELSDGHALHYCDMRLFGRLQIVPGARFETLDVVAELGPDPLVDGLDARTLASRLSRLRTPIKVAVMDQRLIAGLGNIQASESLYRARLDPRRPSSSLSPAEIERLITAIDASISHTLKTFARDFGEGDVEYVEEPGSDNPFLIYGREGERCRKCRRETIVRIVQAQRSTFYCPRCQAK